LEALTRQVDEETARLMLTNPSTIGVFESQMRRSPKFFTRRAPAVHGRANMNALVGKGAARRFRRDVMHLNLHKTFSTPHGAAVPAQAGGLQKVSGAVFACAGFGAGQEWREALGV